MQWFKRLRNNKLFNVSAHKTKPVIIHSEDNKVIIKSSGVLAINKDNPEVKRAFAKNVERFSKYVAS